MHSAQGFTHNEIANLSLSTVPCYSDAIRLRAANWFNLIHSLGIHAPFHIVLDLGQLFTLKRNASSPSIKANAGALKQAHAHEKLQQHAQDLALLFQAISTSEVILRCQTWKLSDPVVAVLITKILTPVFREWKYDDRNHFTKHELPLDSSLYKDEGLIRKIDKQSFLYLDSFNQTLLSREHQVRHAIEQLDIDTLRLLGLFQQTQINQSPLELVDLLGLFSMPMVNDVVNFSLQIIPSVLEATKHKDAQVASMDGFEGVERIGSLDNLMLGEFAYDDEIFYQKFLDNELFYFSRTRAREEEEKLHYLLIDSSASMRGQRSVFARGVALAMIKKLLLQNEKPLLRFFDSQLYESIELENAFSVPHLLSFRSERGRHYERVFEQLLFDIRRRKERKPQEIILYILTHGQCHVSNELILRLRNVSYLFGIFILPGPSLELDYLDILDKTKNNL